MKNIADETGTVMFGYDVFWGAESKDSRRRNDKLHLRKRETAEATTGIEVMTFIYGREGIIGFRLGTVKCLYRKNVFGDVEEIYNESGTLVGKYSYTAFGEYEIETDTEEIATKNPFRCRRYCYDAETRLYCLKTRVYAPGTGRFITIDDIS